MDFHRLAEHSEALHLAASYDLGLNTGPNVPVHCDEQLRLALIHYKYCSFGRSETVNINAQKDNRGEVAGIP